MALLAPAERPVRVRLDGKVRPVPLETYVEWVLAGEMGGVAEAEALRAMAVVARTWARTNAGRHRADGFDFCQTTHCQRLAPAGVSARIREAAEDTAGVTLWYRGRNADVFHAADCGGRTASAGEIWPGMARPYLPSKEDPWCVRAGSAAWRAEIRWPELEEALGLRGLRHLAVSARSGSGRVLRLETSRGPVDAETLHLRVGRALGWNLLRSRAYVVESGSEGAVFQGKGSGHGAGLCQKGAVEMAKSGANFREILAFYFPGTAAGISARGLAWRRQGAETVDVWTLDGAMAVSAALADGAWREARRRSGLDAPCRPRVREYPDPALFRDSTGAGGGLAAVTRGCVIHLNSPARLAARGALGQVLLHEMVHVLIGARRRAPLPEWFEEGLAEWLSGGAARPAERARVDAMIRRYGLESVLRFLETGLPE
jgi:stage II sporulation protein D